MDKGFKPLPEDLRGRLRELCRQSGPGNPAVIEDFGPCDDALSERGMVDVLETSYMGTTAMVEVTWQGARYEQDLAEWEREQAEAAALDARREDAARAERAEAERRTFRHDRRMTGCSGAFTIAASVISGVLGWILGHMGWPV